MEGDVQTLFALHPFPVFGLFVCLVTLPWSICFTPSNISGSVTAVTSDDERPDNGEICEVLQRKVICEVTSCVLTSA